MLKELTIRNFRALEDVTLKNLSRINLIGGKNGAGKTSVLEARWMLAAPTSPDIAYRIRSFRGLDVVSGNTIFRDLFPDMNEKKRIVLGGRVGVNFKELTITLQPQQNRLEPLGNGLGTGQFVRNNSTQAIGSHQMVFEFRDSTGKQYHAKGVWAQETRNSGDVQSEPIARGIFVESTDQVAPEPAHFSIPRSRSPHGSLAANYGTFQLERQDSQVLDVVREIGPKVTALVPITLGDEVMLHAEVENHAGLFPVNLLGEGALRALEIALSLAQIESGSLLIDEIENGLHYSALTEFFAKLHNLAEHFDVQVFATTHSFECVKAAHDALGPVGERFNYHRIGRRNGKARAVSYDEDMLNTAFEVGWEVR